MPQSAFLFLYFRSFAYFFACFCLVLRCFTLYFFLFLCRTPHRLLSSPFQKKTYGCFFNNLVFYRFSLSKPKKLTRISGFRQKLFTHIFHKLGITFALHILCRCQELLSAVFCKKIPVDRTPSTGISRVFYKFTAPYRFR